MSGPGHADVDIAIVGGGMVGASLALALAQTPMRIALVEGVDPAAAAPQPSFDDRTTALGNGTRRILEALGVWDEVRPEAAPIRTIHVSDAGRFGFARLEAAQQGIDAFGFVVVNRVLGRALWSRLGAQPTLLRCMPARAGGGGIEGDARVLALDSNQAGVPRVLRARLLVAADGAQSLLRSVAGIEAEVADYGQVAVIANLASDRPHHGVAYERFTPSGPIALLPLASGDWGVVWTLTPQRAAEALAWDDARFRDELQHCFGWRAGRFTRVGRRASYPLKLLRASQPTAERLVLIGNAAQSLHPVAGQGFNLGLRDAATLAEVLVEHAGRCANAAAPFDPGAADVLAEFARRRADDRAGVTRFTDGLVRLFGDARPGVGLARDLRAAAVRSEPDREGGAVARQLGIRGPYTAPRARPARWRHEHARRERCGSARTMTCSSSVAAWSVPRSRPCCRACRRCPRRASRCWTRSCRRCPPPPRRPPTRPPDCACRRSRAPASASSPAPVWPAILAAGPCAYERMHVWPHDGTPRGAGALSFDAATLHEPDLGHIVENRVLQSAALAAFAAAGGRLIAASVATLAFDADGVSATLQGAPAAAPAALRARLVVGADGARSGVRRLAGLDARVEDYQQLGIVARVRPERPHEATAWQRFLGHGTLALLPLASGECSIVWSLPQADARRLLEVSAAQFEHELTVASAGVLGPLQLASERIAPPLQRLLAPQYAVERVALIGDAAHVVHPLAGQGVTLGLLDAAALAEVLAAALTEGEDPGALRVLRRYERWRKGENEAMSLAFDAFNALLSTGQGALATAGPAQPRLGGGSEAAKRFFLERALGTAGDLPAAARAVAGVS